MTYRVGSDNFEYFERTKRYVPSLTINSAHINSKILPIFSQSCTVVLIVESSFASGPFGIDFIVVVCPCFTHMVLLSSSSTYHLCPWPLPVAAYIALFWLSSYVHWGQPADPSHLSGRQNIFQSVLNFSLIIFVTFQSQLMVVLCQRCNVCMVHDLANPLVYVTHRAIKEFNDIKGISFSSLYPHVFGIMASWIYWGHF